MQRIMVPLDGSAFAEQALPLAVAIASRTDARLHLVTVRASYPIEAEMATGNSYVHGVAALLQSQVTTPIIASAITNDLAALHYHPPQSTLVVDALVRYAEDHDIDLILTTTHGRGGIQRSWLGSVTDSLTRSAKRPLIAIRPTDRNVAVPPRIEHGIAHILVPLDGSTVAEQAILEARRLGDAFNAQYTLLRVISPLVQLSTGTDVYPLENSSPLSRRAAAEYLREVAADLRRDGITVHTRVVEDTSAAQAILAYARVHAADLIALSTTGVGGIRRMLLGSVADKIMRSSDVPVLLCTAEHTEPRARPIASVFVAGTAEAP